MIRALATTQAPAYVSFRAAVDTPVDRRSEHRPPARPRGTASTATAGGHRRPRRGGDRRRPPPSPSTMTLPTVSADQAASIVQQIIGFTGLQPVDQSLWLGGPTFAAFLPREDAEELVDLVRSIGVSLGLVVRLEGGPPATAKGTSERLLGHKKSFPVLAAHRALQPATWGYDFTTSTLAPASGEQSGTADTTPDEAGTHVIVVIWIARVDATRGICSAPSLLMVGVPGFEPGTSSSRTMRATRLRYTPPRGARRPLPVAYSTTSQRRVIARQRPSTAQSPQAGADPCREVALPDRPRALRRADPPSAAGPPAGTRRPPARPASRGTGTPCGPPAPPP